MVPFLSRTTRASYAVLIACTLAHFMNHIYTGALGPLLPTISIDLGLTLTEAGAVTSVAILTMTITHLAIGYFADRGWRDIFISVSVFFSAIMILVSSFATSFIFLFVSMAFLGIGASPHHPSAFPALTEKFPKSDRAKATGVHGAGGLIGMALIPFLGVSLLFFFGGWREALLILALIGFVILIPVVFLMRNSTNGRYEEEVNNETSEAPKGWTRNYYLMIGFIAMRGIPFRCMTLLMPLYLVLSYGYEPFWAGSLTTLMLVAGLFGEVVSAPLSDRSGKRIPYMILSIGTMVPALLLLNLQLDPIPLILVLVFIGFFYFLGVPPGQAYETEICPDEQRGLAFGIFFSVGAIPGALAPWIFGAIGDFYGLSASIIFLVIVSLLGTLIATQMREVEPSVGTTLQVPLE